MVEIEQVTPALIAPLRRQHAADLGGPADGLISSMGEADGALHVGLMGKGGPVGYATFSPEWRDDRALLEIYTAPEARHLAPSFLTAALAWVMPVHWDIYSYDRLALSLAMNAGHTLKHPHTWQYTQAALLTAPGSAGVSVRMATKDDIERLGAVLPRSMASGLEDGFPYEPPKAPPFPLTREVPPDIALADQGRWVLAVEPTGGLVGCGAYVPTPRTPSYAAAWVGVVPDWRRQGVGSQIMGALGQAARAQGLTLSAACNARNVAAHKLLTKTGFYADGRIWRLKF